MFGFGLLRSSFRPNPSPALLTPAGERIEIKYIELKEMLEAESDNVEAGEEYHHPPLPRHSLVSQTDLKFTNSQSF